MFVMFCDCSVTILWLCVAVRGCGCSWLLAAVPFVLFVAMAAFRMLLFPIATVVAGYGML